jgi:hypothetical protein
MEVIRIAAAAGILIAGLAPLGILMWLLYGDGR